MAAAAISLERRPVPAYPYADPRRLLISAGKRQIR
jgi:hypothetical protein